ncbi:MAG: hypothetical protein R3344_09475, partial [Acidobacteriota bacterium]|nr:hypothetical protein [Acidobacteriota bacterium]
MTTRKRHGPLPLSPSDTDKAWNEALFRASRRLSEKDDLAHLYHEERADLRVRFELDGAVEIVPSEQRGMCVRTSGSPPRSVFLGGPAIDDANDLVSMALGQKTRPHAADSRSSADDDDFSAWIAAALDSVQTLCAMAQQRLSGTAVAIGASWVAFRQRVRVARPGHEVCEDLRQ